MQWQHLALLVNNKPGVLAHVAGLLARRNINIECLNVATRTWRKSAEST